MFRNNKNKRKKRIFKRDMTPKVCKFCHEKAREIDYKDVSRIKRYTSGRGKILAASITGNCAKHQRMLTTAIKRARFMALLPFVQE
ncbi:MAG: 30S ribosomal protein S18 [Candidatus Omnitrophica bacterium]|jgi:small subunit ribosomal protein S18|nr:30S ribosomal protein S18 [Candidatus Omnitrophota bacterium]